MRAQVGIQAGLRCRAPQPGWATLPVSGAPPAGELRCRCVRAVAERIPPRHLVQVELIPEGPHCAAPEVMWVLPVLNPLSPDPDWPRSPRRATTKQGHTLCLSPSVPWVKLLVARFLNRYLARCPACLQSRGGRGRSAERPLSACSAAQRSWARRDAAGACGAS